MTEKLIIATMFVVLGGGAIYGMVVITWIMVAEQMWLLLGLTYLVLIGMIVDQFYPYAEK
jgi:hypothetical protein